jgi:hypothetical protein
MTELLIIKAGDDYFKFDGREFVCCEMNKASVFPLSQLETARALQHTLQARGIAAVIMKLTILETPYAE